MLDMPREVRIVLRTMLALSVYALIWALIPPYHRGGRLSEQCKPLLTEALAASHEVSDPVYWFQSLKENEWKVAGGQFPEYVENISGSYWITATHSLDPPRSGAGYHPILKAVVDTKEVTCMLLPGARV